MQGGEGCDFDDTYAFAAGGKIIRRFGEALRGGPDGLAKPAKDLSRGCKAEDIVNVAAITALQAMSLRKASARG